MPSGIVDSRGAALIVAVLMPTSSPREFTSAPPELPTLIAASVWMKSSKFVMPSWPRPVALTMPIVTVWLSPSELPIASTTSPTWRLSERPSAIDGRSGRSILSSASSLSGSEPTICGVATRPSAS